MNTLKTLVATAAIAANITLPCSLKAEIPKEADMAGYLMVYHKDSTHSLHMAVSHDGYSFIPLNGDNPIIAGDTIATQKGIRDPHIYRGPDGAFYMSMTDLHIYGKQNGYRDTDWERPAEEHSWGNNHGFVLMKSFDLINWTQSVLHIDKVFPDLNVSCAWAPETIYDPAAEKMMLYFTMRLDNGKTKLYYAYTDDDYTTLVSRPELLFTYPNPEIQILDADISPLPGGGYCLMYVAQENPGGIRMALSNSSVNSGYQYFDLWADTEDGACEAPNVWKRIGQDKWVVMYDIFSINPHNFGFCETSDFKTFEPLGRFNEGPMKSVGFQSPKHGAIVQITADELTRLEKAWL